MDNNLISRETLLNDFDTKCQSMCPACEYHKWNSKLKRYECELINTAPPVKPRIEYGTDGQPYKLSMTNGKEHERPQVEKKPVFKYVPTYRKYEDYHDAEQYVRGWNDAMRFIFGIEER